MVEVELWLITIRKNPRFLIREKIYSLAHIIRETHVIPATLPQVQYWFVNNYMDWDQLNLFYDKDFEKKGTRVTDKISYQFK